MTSTGARDSAVRGDPTIREVFWLLARRRQPMSPRKIAIELGLTVELAEAAVRELDNRGLVHYEKAARGSRLDERHMPVTLIEGASCFLGVRILPDKLICVATNLRGEILPPAPRGPLRMTHRLYVKPLPHCAQPVPEADKVISDIVQVVQELSRRLGERQPRGLGIELGGHITPTGTVAYSPNLQWHDVELRDVLRQELRHTELSNLEVTVENDVNSLAVVEHWLKDPPKGRPKASSLAVVLFGDGVGCGLVLNNDLIRGASGVAGEFGHLIVEPRGSICRCGNRGCLEGIATGDAILKHVQLTKEARGEKPPDTIPELLDLVRERDPVARYAFQIAGEALARALGSLLNLVNPKRLLVESVDEQVMAIMWRTVKEFLPLYAFSTALKDCHIEFEAVPKERGARGAAAVAISRFLEDLRFPVPATSLAGTVG